MRSLEEVDSRRAVGSVRARRRPCRGEALEMRGLEEAEGDVLGKREVESCRGVRETVR